MKSLHDSLIVALDGEEKLEASIPVGCHAISGPGGYIVMPDELTVEEWEARQDDPECIKARQKEKARIARDMEARQNSSKSDKGAKDPKRCNGAQIRDISAPTPTPADEAADEAAFDKLFPDLEKD